MSDSPLSIAASITGLLTFVAAVMAGFYAHALGLRDAVDTQAEISSALDKIYLLETETDMLNNAYLASLIRQPDRKYGTGDFKYFQGLYVQSLERMRVMDRELRTSAELVTKGDGYGRISRVKRKAAWMASRARIQRDIDERKTESIRIFQIQLAMLSAVKDNKVSIDDLKDGSSVFGQLKGSILKETLRSMELSSQCTVDTQKNIANGSAMEVSGTKTPTGLSRKTSISSKRKSWYSLSSRKSEDCKPSTFEQTSLCNQTEIPKDRKTTPPHATRELQPSTHKTTSNNPITIIVTSPTSDTNTQPDSCSISSTSSHSSCPSLKSTSSFDPSLLMPPFPPTPLKYDIPKSNEAPEVKKWLIVCMNRKADTLPRKLVFRMMEIYGIKKEELDPTMWGKLQQGVVDEGVVLSVDVDVEDMNKNKNEDKGNIEGEKQEPEKEKKKEEINTVDKSGSPRISFYSRGKRGRKDISSEHHHPNNPIPTKRHSYPNSISKPNNNNINKNHTTITTIKNINPPPKPLTTNPRIWQNPSSRARNWPTTTPNNNSNHHHHNMMNMHHNAAFSFPPYAHTNPHAKRPSTQHGKQNRYGKMTKRKMGVCPPSSRRGSMVSLGRIPECEE
ncbi:hypothetical protein ACHAP3_008344 [Botrytis cinerea]